MGNLFKSISAARSLGNNRGPRIRDKSETSLLHSKFYELYIGFIPLGFDVLHILSNSILDFRKKFSHEIGAKKWVHACIFITAAESGDGILFEYGAYVKGDDKYSNETFYLKDSGLRYTQMNVREFKRLMNKENEFINKPGNKVKNIPYILCKVNSKNLFYQLLFRTIFGNILHENPELTLKKILYEEEYKKIYCADAYKLLSNNCQCFVAKVIEASFCTINTDHNRQDNENE